MKVLYTIKVNHTIDGEKREGRTLVCLDSMTKDGNTYEFVKTYKMDKACPDIPNGSVGTPLFVNDRGKVGSWRTDH